VAYTNIDPAALDALLDSADALAAEVRALADDAEDAQALARAAELRILACLYAELYHIQGRLKSMIDVCRRAVDDLEGI